MEGKANISYIDAISTMMYGFGDNPIPDPESVRLVESAVLKQVRDILHEASKHADRRNAKTVSTEDILFLMRRERHKMHRFIKYIEYKYTTLTTINCNDADPSNFSNTKKSKLKKFETLKAIISNIDETGELIDTNDFDNIKYERMIRAERISSVLDEDKYKEYTRARQASFSNKQSTQSKKFREWVDPFHEIHLSTSAAEIIELVAYSIVGHITDMALIIRQNNRRTSNDPLQMLNGSFFNSSIFNAPHIPEKKNSISLGQPAITVREIREVLRRYYNPQVGFMNFSYKSVLGKRKLMMC